MPLDALEIRYFGVRLRGPRERTRPLIDVDYFDAATGHRGHRARRLSHIAGWRFVATGTCSTAARDPLRTVPDLWRQARTRRGEVWC